MYPVQSVNDVLVAQQIKEKLRGKHHQFFFVFFTLLSKDDVTRLD